MAARSDQTRFSCYYSVTWATYLYEHCQRKTIRCYSEKEKIENGKHTVDEQILWALCEAVLSAMLHTLHNNEHGKYLLCLDTPFPNFFLKRSDCDIYYDSDFFVCLFIQVDSRNVAITCVRAPCRLLFIYLQLLICRWQIDAQNEFISIFTFVCLHSKRQQCIRSATI